MQSFLSRKKTTPISLEQIVELCPEINGVIYDDIKSSDTLNSLCGKKDGIVIYYTLHGKGDGNIGHCRHEQEDSDEAPEGSDFRLFVALVEGVVPTRVPGEHHDHSSGQGDQEGIEGNEEPGFQVRPE